MVSIIVPVYNTIEYLERCINSLREQTYQNLEIILVNDGSTDGSGSICDRYACEDGRIRVIHQENSGASKARKRGISSATGRWIIFVDADDWMERDYVEQLVSEIGDADMLSCGYTKEFTGDNILIFDAIEPGLYCGDTLEIFIKQIIYSKACTFNDTFSSIWNKLFRRERLTAVINYIDVDLRYEEDAALVYTYVMHCDSVVISSLCGYHYCMREDSAIHSQYDYFLSEMNYLYLYLRKLFEKSKYFDLLNLPLQRWMKELVIYGINEKLGFDDSVRIPSFILPWTDMICKKKVILYGAGKIGREYYISMRNTGIRLIHWVDAFCNGCTIFSREIEAPAVLKNADYDYVLVAVKEKSMAEEIKRSLVCMGVPEVCVLWKEPQLI